MRIRTAAAAAVAVAAGAAVVRSRRSGSSEDWPSLQGRAVEVRADDDLVLHADVYGPEEASGTVLLAHGYILSSALWARQVRDVLAARPDLRVVTYDQRGHGLSARGARERSTIAQLGHDLHAVIDATAPTGPVVLAGHSMGGMTLMAFAESYPSLIGPRVVGVGLVATSSGGLTTLTFGFPERVAARVRDLIPVANEQARRREDAGKRPLPQPFLKPVLFGKDPDPADVRRTFQVIAGGSAHTTADFFDTFTTHDRLAALAALRDVPVAIEIGTLDKLCPVAHSRAMADALPHASLHVHPGAGHMLMLERHDAVSSALIDLARAITPALAPVSLA